MPLTPPNLDTRRFQDLVDEARQRIPRYTPEWTNLNDSDPGMTLVKLHAWMTETILFSLNQVPDLSYISFLNLIGLAPQPARPARTELTFTLDKLDKPSDPLVVYLPRLVKVAVTDPNLKQEVVFETDSSAAAINAGFGAVIVPVTDPSADADRELVTIFDNKAGAATWAHSFDPFGTTPAVKAEFFIGVVLRPLLAQPLDNYSEDRFPAGPLDIYVDAVQVFDADPKGTTIAGPLQHDCPAPGTTDAPTPAIEWQVFTGSPEQGSLFDQDKSAGGWTELNLTGDSTLSLTRSGHVMFEIPKEATAISPRELPAAIWTTFGQPKPPANYAELKAALQNPDLDLVSGLTDKDWKAMGLDDSDLEAVLACGEDISKIIAKLDTVSPAPNPGAVGADRWAVIEPKFAVAMPLTGGTLRQLIWLRAVLTDATINPATVRELRFNTVPATQAATKQDERLGRSNGRPGQSFKLQKTPVLIDPLTGQPALQLDLTDAQGTTTWTRVDSFFAQGSDSQVYLLDPATGIVTFGDGRTGQIPVANTDIVASTYRYGGGAIGNVAPDTITSIKGKITGVKAATNVRTAADGSDGETLDNAKLRAPHDLRTRDRAVTADDFAYLAQQTPTVAVHKAYALARKVPDANASSGFADKDGAVTLVILPSNDQPTPQPSEAQLRAVCEWLEPRRLITTELHVTGPKYTEVGSMSVRLLVASNQDLRTVSDAAAAALLGYLHPLTGGSDGTGWPFGEDIFSADLYDLLLKLDGVRRVSALTLSLKSDTDTDPLADVTALPEGHLPYLPRSAIALNVRYE
jgi:Baseplate J-like protein